MNIKTIVSYSCSKIFGIKLYNKLRFLHKQKRWPNLNSPTTFTEKFLDYKLSHFDPLMTVCADKYAARNYVTSKVGSDILIPLIRVFRNVEDFEAGFAQLPKSFAMKAAHGSSWNEIVFDKSKVDLDKLKSKVSQWLTMNYYDYGYERQYKDIPPSIVVEELLVSTEGKIPVDFKFYCFGKGGHKKIIIQVDIDRFDGQHRRVFYTENWQKSDIAILSSKTTWESKDYPRPDNLDEMLDIVRRLSEDFDFSRVDLYNNNGKIYFGEITFHPESGYGMFIEPKSKDIELLDCFV